MTEGSAGPRRSRVVPRLAGLTGSVTRSAGRQLTEQLGGSQRTRVVVVLACVLGLAGADAATVGAAATQLRAALGIGDAGIGLLVTAASLVGAVAISAGTILPGGHGRAELRGTTWSARNVGQALLAAGQRCRVVAVEGLTLDITPE